MKFLRQFTLLILAFITLSAIVAGVLFLMDPDGSLLGISYSYLSDSPFKNFWIPAMVLLLVVGIPGIVVSMITYKSLPGYLKYIVGYAIIIIVFIVIQVKLVESYNYLNTIYILLAVLLLVLVKLISTQKHLPVHQSSSASQSKKSSHHGHRHKKR